MFYSRSTRSSILGIPDFLTAEKQDHRLKILMITSQIEALLKSRSKRVRLDFSRVKKIFPGGLLLLWASLELLLNKYPGRITASCPHNSMASQLFNHFGWAEGLGIRICKASSKSVINWKYLSGTTADGASLKEVLDFYRKTTSAYIPEELFSVLSEALTNVPQHAYDTSSVSEKLRKWWLFSRYDEPDSTNGGGLFIGIYDIGLGIPKTMREKLKKSEIILEWLDKATQLVIDSHKLDKRLLQEAVESRRSQTGQPHRGNGLPDMREFASKIEGGKLHIVSGHAHYTLWGGKNNGQISDFKQKFPGTLLLWSIPLQHKEHST